MFAKVSYFGFYPIGSDVCYNNIKIMQSTWEAYNFPIVLLGKKHTVNPFYGQVFYVKKDDHAVFFVAMEHGHGHHHIFSINDRMQQKLAKRITKK